MNTLKQRRLFIGIPISTQNSIDVAVNYCKTILKLDNVKWVPSDNYHITLKYLGSTEESIINEISQRISAIADQTRSFQIELFGIGIFPNRQNPKVLWIGCGENEMLSALYQEIELKMNNLGFESENRPYHAHLTLARIKPLKNIQNINLCLSKFADTEFYRFKSKEIAIFESVSTNEGVVYKILNKFNLKD